jgi:protease II
MQGWMGARLSSQGPEGPPGEPRAEQHVLARTLHGVSLNDEFDWLKNWREVMRDPLKLDSAIRAYLQAENDYCEGALGETAGLQQTRGKRSSGVYPKRCEIASSIKRLDSCSVLQARHVLLEFIRN